MDIKVMREIEGWSVEIKRLTGDLYQFMYINLEDGKTEVITGSNEDCINKMKEYGICINTSNKHEYDESKAIRELRDGE